MWNKTVPLLIIMPYQRIRVAANDIISPVNRPVDPKQIATEIINTPAFSFESIE